VGMTDKRRLAEALKLCCRRAAEKLDAEPPLAWALSYARVFRRRRCDQGLHDQAAVLCRPHCTSRGITTLATWSSRPAASCSGEIARIAVTKRVTRTPSRPTMNCTNCR